MCRGYPEGSAWSKQVVVKGIRSRGPKKQEEEQRSLNVVFSSWTHELDVQTTTIWNVQMTCYKQQHPLSISISYRWWYGPDTGNHEVQSLLLVGHYLHREWNPGKCLFQCLLLSQVSWEQVILVPSPSGQTSSLVLSAMTSFWRKSGCWQADQPLFRFNLHVQAVRKHKVMVGDEDGWRHRITETSGLIFWCFANTFIHLNIWTHFYEHLTHHPCRSDLGR